MFDYQVLLTFFLYSILLALAPGPDNLFVLTHSALKGRMAGMIVTFGLCTGLIGHTAAVALGLAVIFKVSPVAYKGLMFCGMAYLLYLAWHAFRASASDKMAEDNALELQPWKLYCRGIIMNLTNPKSGGFFPGISAAVYKSRKRLDSVANHDPGDAVYSFCAAGFRLNQFPGRLAGQMV